jgi:hypothetical protein
MLYFRPHASKWRIEASLLYLMRNGEGAGWLDTLTTTTGKKVYCAADFMGRPRQLLEAEREQLYEQMPVPEGWHDEYAEGSVNPDQYLNKIWYRDTQF